jgi:hypothetical protein
VTLLRPRTSSRWLPMQGRQLAHGGRWASAFAADAVL